MRGLRAEDRTNALPARPAHGLPEDQRDGQSECRLLGQESQNEQSRRHEIQPEPRSGFSSANVREQASQIEESHERHRSAADVRDSLGLDGMEGEEKRRKERGSLVRPRLPPGVPAESAQQEIDHDAVRGVEGDVEQVKPEQPEAGRPVDRVGQLEKRADSPKISASQADRE